MTSPILFIDGSGQFSKISLKIFKKDKSLLISKQVKADKKNKLLQDVNELLLENKLTPKALSNSILVSGPGSFTGLRVAGLLSKSLSYFLKINFFSFSKFDLLLDLIKPSKKIILLLVKKTKTTYCGLFIDEEKNKLSSFFDLKFNDSFSKLEEIIKKNNFFKYENLKENLQIEIENSFDVNLERLKNPEEIKPHEIKSQDFKNNKENIQKKVLGEKVKYSFCDKDYFNFFEKEKESKKLEERNYKNLSLFYG